MVMTEYFAENPRIIVNGSGIAVALDGGEGSVLESEPEEESEEESDNSDEDIA